MSRDGSIDGCTLRRFDADPVFCSILDAGRGGFWSIGRWASTALQAALWRTGFGLECLARHAAVLERLPCWARANGRY